jgi:hypothetical protein
VEDFTALEDQFNAVIDKCSMVILKMLLLNSILVTRRNFVPVCCEKDHNAMREQEARQRLPQVVKFMVGYATTFA